MKLVYQYINFSTTSNHLHPLQVDNCDSNSRLLVHEDANGKFRLEMVKVISDSLFCLFVPFKLYLLAQFIASCSKK